MAEKPYASGLQVRIPWGASAILVAAVAYTFTLITWGLRLEARVFELEHIMSSTTAQVRAIDTEGTRAAGPVLQRITDIEAQNNKAAGLAQRNAELLETLENTLAVIKDRQDRILDAVKTNR
jgi:hypothetical protein